MSNNRNIFDYLNGWLEPNGCFHPLKSTYLHCKECSSLKNETIPCVKSPEKYLPYRCKRDFDGWFKLSDGKWICANITKTTKNQYDFIFDWHQYHNREMDDFLKMMQSTFIE